MFIVPCKYHSNSLIHLCLESIRLNHTSEKILIVDSYSDDTSYINRINNIPNVIISDKKNKNYEFGALNIAFELYPNEEKYILIHDSVIFKESIFEFINDKNCYSFLYFIEEMQGHTEISKVSEILANTNYNFDNKNVIGCLGSMCIITNDVMKNFKEKKLFESFLPSNKFESQISERLIGICLQQEGCDVLKNSIEGNFLEKVAEVNEDKLKYIKKIFLKRD